MYTILLRSMERYVLSTIVDVLLLLLPCNIRRFPLSLHSVWAACFLSSPMPWCGSLFKRYRTGNRCDWVYFLYREKFEKFEPICVLQAFESTTWTWKRAEDFILHLITSIISVAEALLILQKQVFLITFWKLTIPGGLFIAIESTSRYTGLSNSEVLVLLGYAFALYGFMCNSDWMEANKFEMVNALMWVRHCGLSCWMFCLMVGVLVRAGRPGDNFSRLQNGRGNPFGCSEGNRANSFGCSEGNHATR